ncbi:MAG TPA: carboxypeptidase-like regulatory domain-containing protein [Thermoanaerobaculia bacterium]|nr:carboxypeptidase-like regulatory domain-containing protein [Thermoanaerobaculia bacterium]
MFAFAGWLLLAAASTPPPTAVHFELVAKGTETPSAAGMWSGSLTLRPAPGAGDAPAVQLTIDPQGSASTVLPAGSSWEISTAVAGYWARRYTIEVGRQPVTQRIDLWPLGKVAGVARFPKTIAKPPASVSVGTLAVPKYLHRPEAPPGLLDCPVDREGRWTCSLPAADYDLVVSAKGFIPQYRFKVQVPAGKAFSLGTFDFAVGASVAGWALVETGKLDPASCIARAEPQLAPGASAAEATRIGRTAVETRVRPDGFFQLTGLAPGSYTLEVRQAGLAPARTPLEVLPASESFLRDPLLMTLPLEIGLAITPPLDAHGQPWEVQIYRASEGGAFRGAPAFNGNANPEGRVTVPRQSPGKFWVTIADSQGNRLYSNRNLQVAGPEDAQKSIELRWVAVKGRLTLGGQPLAATLWFGGKHAVPSLRLEVDAKGRFEGFLPERKVWPVTVEATEPRLETLARVTVEPDSSGKASVAIALPDTRISGWVLEENGRPAPGAEVFLRSAVGPWRAATDERGGFTARGLPEGPLAVSAEGAQGSAQAGWTSDLLQLTLSEGQEADPVELRLQKVKELKGKVISPFGPVLGAMVVALPQGRPGGARATTDATGAWTVKIPERADGVTVIVGAPGKALKAFDAVATGEELALEVTEGGGALEISLPYTAPQASAKGLALEISQDGLSLPPGLLFEWALGQGEAPPAEGDRVRSIPDLAPGRYQVCVVKTGGAAACDAGLLGNGETLRLRPPLP